MGCEDGMGLGCWSRDGLCGQPSVNTGFESSPRSIERDGLAIRKMDFILDDSGAPRLKVFFGNCAGPDSMTLRTTKGTRVRPGSEEVGY